MNRYLGIFIYMCAAWYNMDFVLYILWPYIPSTNMFPCDLLIIDFFAVWLDSNAHFMVQRTQQDS